MTTKKQRKQEKRLRRKQRKLAIRAAEKSATTFCAVDPEASVRLLQAEAGENEGQPRIRRFEMTAYNGGRLFVNGFNHPVVVDLPTLQANRKSYTVPLDHKSTQRVGHTTRVNVDGTRIEAEGLISAKNKHAQEVVENGDAGFPWQSSIKVRFEPEHVRFVPRGHTLNANGRSIPGPVYYAKNTILNHISFVAEGGDEDGADVRIAATADDSTGAKDMNFSAWLAAKGFDVNTISAEQKTFFQQEFDTYTAWLEASSFDINTITAEQNTSLMRMFEAQADPPSNNGTGNGAPGSLEAGAGDAQSTQAQIAERRRLEAAETTRIDRIREICAEYDSPTFQVQNRDVSLEAHAIQEGWDINQTELEALRQSRGSASVQAHSHGTTCTIEAMQGASLIANGVPLDWEGFGSLQARAMNLPSWLGRSINDDTRQRYMEAAHQFTQMHSVDVCREAIRLDGRMVPSGRENIVQASFSGSNLLNIWTTNVNARLLMKFREIEDSTRGWCREADVPDFRLNERGRVQKGGRLKKHARGKSADHHSGSDTKEEYRIARYSDQLFIDDMDIIDDRLMALPEVIDEMALAAARLRPDLVYAILLGNPDMKDGTAIFDASRGNVDAAAAFAEATLKAAITRMRLLQENSINLDLRPTHIVCSATLDFDVRQQLRSAETRAASASGGPTKNPVENAVTNIVSDSRIDNGVIDPDTDTTIAGDATAWFLISAFSPTIEVGYRRGTGRAPQSTTWRKNGEDGIWGLGASVKMDIGGAAMTWQSMQKMSN